MLNRKFEIKKQGGKKTLELYLYGDIQDDYFDWFYFEKVESTTSANYVRKAIDEAGATDEINVYINSCGGSVKEGVAIYNILKRSSAYVTVYIDAFAYSVASVIAMAGDKIVMPSNATMFIHRASWVVGGNSKQLRKSADDLDVIDGASNASYLAKAGDKLDEETLNRLLDNETFLNAEDAYKYGLCDEVTGAVSMTKEREEVIEQSLKNPENSSKKKQAVKQFASCFAKEKEECFSEKGKTKKSQKDFYENLMENLEKKKLI